MLLNNENQSYIRLILLISGWFQTVMGGCTGNVVSMWHILGVGKPFSSGKLGGQRDFSIDSSYIRHKIDI